MTKTEKVREKKKFIRELVGAVRDRLLDRVGDVPEEWDGIELRQWIADTFAQQAYSLTMRQDRKRLKAFRNECLVRNLT